jgi:hypothetical protein
MRTFVALGALVALAWWPTAALGQAGTCVMLPPPATQAPPTAREQIQGAVAEALRSRGVVVLATRDAQMRMTGQPMHDCAAIDCADEVNRYLGTAFAVLTEIAWAGGRVTMINIAIIGLEDGESVGGQAEVTGGDAAGAARAAFQAAWDRWEASQQGYVSVTTTPEGAFIDLDGQSIGRAPVRRLARAGAHTIRATLEGYEPATRDITIDRHEERALEIALDPEGTTSDTPEPQPATPTTREEGHWSNFLVATGLILGGGAALISPIWTLVDQGVVTVVGTGMGPDEYVQFGPVSGVLLGIGAAAIVGGVIIMIAQPIRTTVTVSPDSARLTISGTF